MKKTLLLAGVATALFVANVNAAEVNPYVGAKIRYVDMNVEVYDDGWPLNDQAFGGSVAFGLATKVNGGAIRTEVEYNINSDIEEEYADISMKTKSIMLNAYYDIDTGSKFTPYFGAGIGRSSIEIEDGWGSYDDDSFAWQAGFGTAYNATENASFDIGYRYVDYGDWEGIVEPTAHELYLGARYSFK